MARDSKAAALHRLFVAHANYDAAMTAKKRTRERLDAAIVKAVGAGLSRAEVGRAIGQSSQRIGQVVSRAE